MALDSVVKTFVLPCNVVLIAAKGPSSAGNHSGGTGLVVKVAPGKSVFTV